jgi:hypothetical protein
MTDVHVWAIRNPDGGANGLEFARATVAPHDEVLVHAAPSTVDVRVYENGGALVALGEGLEATGDAPMARLRIDGLRISREEVWPTEREHGMVVILCGGEAGILRAWSNDGERSEWRWRLELSNRRSPTASSR